MTELQDDRVDLFNIFQTIWDGKWIITTFTVIALLLGSGFLYLKDPLYESKLFYNIENVPPFYDDIEILKDFEKKFYSISVFEDWKKSNTKTSLKFKDYNMTKVVDGFVLSKSGGGKLAILKSKIGKKRVVRSLFLLIKTNQLSILEDFFKYSNHINQLLKKEYVARAKKELKNIELRKSNFSINEVLMYDVLATDRFITAIEKGANVLAIQHPLVPIKVSAGYSLVLTLVAFLSVIMGVFFIFIRNAIMKRKEQLVKE
jgi:hypothetical protein